MLFASAAYGQTLNMDKLKGLKPRSIGPGAMSGRVTAVDVVLSNTDIIYAGTASGGLWKSASKGITWESIFDKEKYLSIGAVAVQQDNPSVVWVGTGEGNPRNSNNGGYGIYKSLDAGKTWKLMGLEKTRHIHRILIDPSHPNTVYVASIGSPWGEHPERGVYKTTDGGATWERVLFVDNKTGCAELVMDPSNPNKLIASMWEHRRYPWTFSSGGPSSGMYITLDGGKTWTKKTSKDGLPEGDLGRMGLAIARSRPERVYALVEAKKNALYVSNDGGDKWTMVNDKEEIGDRPFYYFEIYVDPKNENRLYSIFSVVNVSEDGGRSFRSLLPYAGVHPDHHAWWIHPEDPSFMIDGNDGGLNITHDMGKTWYFVENIPVGQFYHVNVDNDIPYNVYGGLQDNGSWVGPAYVWKDEGIRNSYWQAVMFGDGFDVIPDPDNSRYGYAMSQGGNLGRYDRQTGYTKTIRPTHPDVNAKLRFNWNSAFAQDPFDSHVIYYGSQFVHKSTNKGSSWEVISPDLTTNDPAKQKQHESGGLTMDATGAENHCTLLALVPSKLEKGVLWAGTDDGQVQLTRDGGATWTNLTAKITGMPRNAWVPQIQVSSVNKGEAFVVVNNYRNFDYKPYLFRTRDYGATWESLVTEAQVPNYTLAVVQDMVEPKLLFLGTESGLYVSLDDGKSWTSWTANFPAGISTMDLVIHPREYDLVIGTFGRAIYVLDDIRPLRELVKSGTSVLDKTAYLFDPPDAYQAVYQDPGGVLFPGNGMFTGDNRPTGAMISYVINKPEEKKEEPKAPAKEEKPAPKGKKSEPRPQAATAPVTAEKKDDKPKMKYDSVTLEVFNAKNELIRTVKQKAPDDNGINRMQWNMTEKGVRFPSRTGGGGGRRSFEPPGLQVLPGTYKLRFSFGGQKDSSMIVVKADPRFTYNADAVQARYALLREMQSNMELATQASDRLKESMALLDDFEKRIKAAKRDDLKSAAEQTKAMKDSVTKLMDHLFGKEDKRQGIVRSPDPTPVSYVQTAMQYLRTAMMEPVGPTEQRVVKFANDKLAELMNRINAFYETQWPTYRSTMEKVSLSPFKDYAPIRKN